MAKQTETALASISKQHSRFVLLIFLLSIGSFGTGAIVARSAFVRIANVSQRLTSNVAPSIEKLASIRGLALEIQIALSQALQADATTIDKLQAVDDALAMARSTIDRYRLLPLNPGEQRTHQAILTTWLQLAESVQSERERIRAHDIERAREQMNGVEHAVDALVRASIEGVEFNAQYAATQGTKIDELRRRAELSTGTLMAAGVLLSLLGAMLMYRRFRRSQSRADQRLRDLGARTEELEMFAGRVAHDIRGPLGAASLAVELLARHEDGGDDVTVARLKRSLARTSVIIDHLLQFARAGAKPDLGARTSPRAVVEDIGADLDDEAAKIDITIQWRDVPPVLVACGEGAYLSLLGNLVRNAIKYMGSSSVRRITVSVTDEGATVRTEVTDTGLGIPEDQQCSIFEPYFRGNSAAATKGLGLGLGLATVRRLAEGHGGRTGVSSQEGRGSRFWFTLPRAGSLPE